MLSCAFNVKLQNFSLKLWFGVKQLLSVFVHQLRGEERGYRCTDGQEILLEVKYTERVTQILFERYNEQTDDLNILNVVLNDHTECILLLKHYCIQTLDVLEAFGLGFSNVMHLRWHVQADLASLVRIKLSCKRVFKFPNTDLAMLSFLRLLGSLGIVLLFYL